MGSADLSPDVALVDAGLDSITSVDLRNQLQDAFGLKLPNRASLAPPIDHNYVEVEATSL